MKKRISIILIAAIVMTSATPVRADLLESAEPAYVLPEEIEEELSDNELTDWVNIESEELYQDEDLIMDEDPGELLFDPAEDEPEALTDNTEYEDTDPGEDDDPDDFPCGYHDLKNEQPVEDVDLGIRGSYEDIGQGSNLLRFNAALPAKYINTAIPELRNQKPYETCWAHSSMALGEINLIRQGYETTDVDLSELQLVYFSYNSVTDPLGGTEGDRNAIPDSSSKDPLDVGGNLIFSCNVLASWTGAVSESVVPYSSAERGMTLSADYAYSYDKVVLTDYYKTKANLLSDNETDYDYGKIGTRTNAIKKLIYENGAVGFSYRSNRANYCVSRNSFYTSGKKKSTNHAVTVVGWDDDFDREYFNKTAPGNGAWLVRNSWLPGGKMEDNLNYDGYFWMSYYDASISTLAFSFKFEPLGKYDNNYQYDGAMYDSDVNARKGANVFRAHAGKGLKGEVISAASFATNSSDVEYTIDIYTGLTDPDDPESGKKACTVTGKTKYPGYHTVDLGRKVPVNDGDLFSVVVELNGGKLLYEAAAQDTWYKIDTSAGERQSFVRTGSEWRDFGSDYNSNLRIKAFTNDDNAPVVSFDLNGGTMDKFSTLDYRTGVCSGDASVDDVVRAYGIDINWKKDTPKRKYYLFEGWYDEPEGGSVFDLNKKVTGDVTVYAHWLPSVPVDDPVFRIQDDDQIYDEDGPKLYEDAVILINSATEDASIYYTLDGSDPSLSTNKAVAKYTGGIRVRDIGTDQVSINAFGRKEGHPDSGVVTYKCSVIKDSVFWGDIAEEDRAAIGSPSNIPAGIWLGGLKEEYTYSNVSIVPDVRVYDGRKLLEKGSDYKITYANNKNAYSLKSTDAGFNKKKAPRITVTMKGNYTGGITKYFAIKPVTIGTDGVNDPNLSVTDLVLAYTGKVQKGTAGVKYAGLTLKKGKDYTLEYNDGDYKSAGTYTVKIKGKGNYTGTAAFREKIVNAVSIKKASLLKTGKQAYNGGMQVKPVPVLRYNKAGLNGTEKSVYEALSEADREAYDFVYSYRDNIKPGKAYIDIEGVGAFTGMRTASFEITGINLKKTGYEGFTKTFIYSGSAVEQGEGFKVYYMSGKGKSAVKNYLKGIEKTAYDAMDPDSAVARSFDYTYEYTDNINKGNKAKVTLRGINGCQGTVIKKFRINAYDIKETAGSRISVISPESTPYVKGGAKPPVRVFDGTTELVYGRDYTLKYKNSTVYNVKDGEGIWTNRKKIPAIIITGKGNYKGKRTVTYQITKSIQSETDHTVTLTASDKIWNDNADNYITTVSLKDSDGKALKAGTDYEKSFIYYYGDHIKYPSGIIRYMGDRVTPGDVIPSGTVMWVEVTFKGNYSGTLRGEYRLVEGSVDKAQGTVKDQTYTGKAICPGRDDIVINVGNYTLGADDYEIVSYSNNLNKGTGSVTVHGIGAYGGIKTFKFKIKMRKLN